MTAETKSKATNPANNAAETLETVAAVGKETIETVITMSTEAAQEGYKNASAYGKERLDHGRSHRNIWIFQIMRIFQTKNV